MSEALLEAIDRGDEAEVAAVLAGWSEAARRAAAPAVIAEDRATWKALRESFRDRERANELHSRRRRAWVAMFGCADPGELRRCRVPVWIGEATAAVLADRRPPWLREWLAGEMEAARGWGVASTWFGIRTLERAGIVQPLDTDAAVAGMAMALADGDGALAELEADPELLDRVWRLFEVEGGEVGSLARADKYASAEKTWRHAILTLCECGRLDRARLLDASLEALGRGFPWFRAQWFAALHEALKPTAAERAARSDAYLGLLGSPLEGTLAFAVKAVAKADPDPAALLAALPGALGSERKATAKAALALLDRVGGGPAAASLRERYAVGARPVEPPPVATPPAAAPARTPLVAPGDAEALAALLDRALERDLPDPDDLDLALDGIARLCGDRTPWEGPLSPLLPRARTLAGKGRLLAVVLVAWADGASVPDEVRVAPAVGIAWQRGLEVARLAAAGRPRTLLATPTHRGSFVAFEALAARTAADPEGAGPYDAQQARFRLPAPDGPPRPGVAVHLGERGGSGWPIRVDAGDTGEGAIPALWDLVLGEQLPWVHGDLGADGLRWLRATWPAFSQGLSALAPALVLLGAAESVTGVSVVLENLLDPEVPLEGTALQALAFGLGAEQDFAGLMAREVAGTALHDGRLDGAALGAVLGEAIASGHSAPKRVARRLAALADTGPEASAAVRGAIEPLPAVAGRDAHHLLELLDDLCARDRTPVASAATREWLAGRHGSTKTARLARSLLARS